MRDAVSKESLARIIRSAGGKEPCDVAFVNCKVLDVFNKEVFEGDVYVTEGHIAGFGGKDFPKARKTVDLGGKYLLPGFIDSHIHIESSHLVPSEFSKLAITHGTTAVVADPHEICNVCGIDGIDFMMADSADSPVSVFFQVPSCVPCTPFENAGAVMKASDIAKRISSDRVLGIGELMDYVSVAAADGEVLDKVLVARNAGKVIDGHSPGASGPTLDAYSSCGVRNDHECATADDLQERVRRGMYVMLRQGTVCHDLVNLLKGAKRENYGRLLMCTDDCQAKTLLETGHIDNNIRMAIGEGVDPISAVCMATVNAAQCFRMEDRGAIAPGYRADFVVSRSLDASLKPEQVYVGGELVSDGGKCLVRTSRADASKVSGRMNVAKFGADAFALKLKSRKVKVIKVNPGSVVTSLEHASVVTDASGNWVRGADDIVKVSVLERHHGKGTIGVGLLKDFGLRGGALATTVAHDSHNLIVAGDDDADMKLAADELIRLGGGMCVTSGGRVLCSVKHGIAGLMTDEDGRTTADELAAIQRVARERLGINPGVDPFMTLCFMSLIVIPELKITDQGIFDVASFKFTDICD